MIRSKVSQHYDELCVFTDGSRKDSGLTGAGWVVYWRGREVSSGSTQTGSKREVFDAELIGMLEGLTGAIGQARGRGITGINIFVDNDAALQAVKSGTSSSSLKVVKSFDNRARKWLKKDAHNRLRLSWVPGHAKVNGNERADYLAERATSGAGTVYPSAASVSYLMRQVSKRAHDKWRAAWETATTSRSGWYFRTRVTVPSHRSGATLQLPRRDLGILLQIRTGHGDFANYHERFHHHDAQMQCLCGRRRSPLHPLRCSSFETHQGLLNDDRGHRFSDEALLNDKNGIRALLAFMRASGAYERGTYAIDREDEVWDGGEG
ncbi:hypothetical protein CF319_g9264 [Tilletia indica]|nr:hypothetical protein CF319_g9264 [Tilletia indica]KAE8218752.1 hypothetical protein CF326_g9098 [Tilletia indica]